MGADRPLSILLVDDEEGVCEIIQSVLEMRYPRAHIYCAADGRIGLDHFRTYLPDIVVTDLNMPEMDGIQLLTVIRATKPETGVIVVTAHSDWPGPAESASAAIPIEYISKPIDFGNLFAAVDRCIASLKRFN